jgi:hypothetical protein
MNLIDTLNSREKAIGIWLLVFLVWAITKKEIRSSIWTVIKSMFFTKLAFVFLGTILYATTIVGILWKFNLWSPLLIKDTIFWIIGTGYILLMNLSKGSQKGNYFKKTALDSIKLTVILEFLLSLYTFNFWVEIFLMPILFFVVAMNAYVGLKVEYKPVQRLTNWLLIIAGGYNLLFAFSQAIQHYHDLATLYNLQAFILPPILTISFLPFLYFFALLMAYETLFVRLDILIRNNKELVRYAKRQIFSNCGLRLATLNRFVDENNCRFLKITTEKDVRQMMQDFVTK